MNLKKKEKGPTGRGDLREIKGTIYGERPLEKGTKGKGA